MKLKGVIFDMDGVIVDTVPIHFAAWKRMFADYGVDFTFEDYKQKVDGIPRTDGAKAILTNLTDDELVEASDKKQRYFLDVIQGEEIPVYSSTIDLINQLKTKGIKVAVISSSKNAPSILKRINLYSDLDAIVSGHDIKKGKPNPEIFLMAAEKLKIKPEEAIVVEDAILGVEAAINAGMKCVAIDRYDNPKRLQKANVVVKDLSEIQIEDIIKLVEGDR
ncbi:MAG: beta-phosphoglucomutase family hydrolase [Pseudomonadota bacterium]